MPSRKRNKSCYQSLKDYFRSDIRKDRVASVHRIITTKDKVPENRRHLCGRKRKVTPKNEALILRSIEELRE